MRSLGDMQVKIRWKCAKCHGTGLAGYYYCGKCGLTYRHDTLTVTNGLLGCGHEVVNLLDKRTTCKTCDGTSWVERWVHGDTLKVWLDQGGAW
jgi:hypothetical protein